MKTLFRIFLILCVAALAAFVWAYWYFSPVRIKAHIASGLSQMLDRDVALDAGWVDWSGPAIVVENLRISERAGFGTTSFLTVSRAQVDFSPLPLLLGQAKLGELVLEQVVASAIVNKRGELNAADIWTDQKLILPVDRVRISNGTIHYANAQTARTTTITGIEGKIQGALTEDGIRVKTGLSGQAYGGVLSVQAVMDAPSDTVAVEASVSLTDAPAEHLRQVLEWDIPLFGQADIGATLKGIADTAFVLTYAKGTMEMAQGHLAQWDVLKQALKSVEPLADQIQGDIPVRDVLVAFEIAGRTVRLDGTQFIAADMPCRISGAGEIDGPLNYEAELDVPASHIRFGGLNLGLLMGQAVKIPLRITVEGTLSHPKIQVGMR